MKLPLFFLAIISIFLNALPCWNDLEWNTQLVATKASIQKLTTDIAQAPILVNPAVARISYLKAQQDFDKLTSLYALCNVGTVEPAVIQDYAAVQSALSTQKASYAATVAPMLPASLAVLPPL